MKKVRLLRLFRWMALLQLLSAALLPLAAHAATKVAVSPGYTNLGVSATLQYSATVTGLSNTGVKWEINGIVGGSSTIGTITTAGLYKAPATIPTVSTLVEAVATDGTIGCQYVNIEAAGPSITAINPSPIPTGNPTITLTGTGFKSGATISMNGNNLDATYVNAMTLKTSIYVSAAGTAVFQVANPGTLWGPQFTATLKSGTPVEPQTISPASATVILGQQKQFTSSGATSWTTTAGTITSAGLYTAPSTMPASSAVTVTATRPGGSAKAAVTLASIPPPPPTPTITAAATGSQLPLGIFSATVTGSGFLTSSVASLNGTAVTTTYTSPTSLTISGFAGLAGVGSLQISNGTSESAVFPVQVGVVNAKVSAAAARRFLEQAAFGPTPADATTVQTTGYQQWLTNQFNMAPVSNYNSVTGDQGGMAAKFLTNAVTNPDQLRQRVAFALSQILVTSLQKLIWNGNMVSYQNMLLNDAFGNYRQIMSDVTLSPAMGQYLDMGNNAKADPSTGAVANENYARELMQLFTIGTALLNDDGTVQTDSSGIPLPTYSQFTVTEFARVYTGWTYAPTAGNAADWGDYYNAGNMIPWAAEHDAGSKQLLNGYVAPAGLTPQEDLDGALDNVFNHPNVGPFVATRLIQHLVKSNPSPAYVSRVAAAFNNNGSGVRGDMKATITAILMDPEARANDNGGDDQPADGHLQEPPLYLAGIFRAFGGQMTTQNYYPTDMANMGEDVFSPDSVFNYYAPDYSVPGTTLMGGEFQIFSPNNAILRTNEVSSLMSQYSSPIANYGPGSSFDLTPFLPLATNPATLVSALDLTLTHGVMPAAMKTPIVAAVTANTGGNLRRVQQACYLILTSNYYNVWH